MSIISIGGRAVEIKPITIGMLNKLAKFVKHRVVIEAIELCKEMPKEVASEILCSAYKEQRADKRSIEEIFQQVEKDQDLEAICYLFALMLEGAGVTQEEIDNLDQQQIQVIMDTVGENISEGKSGGPNSGKVVS